MLEHFIHPKVMTVKELKDLLSNFPDDAEVWTDTNNHSNMDGVTYATEFRVNDIKAGVFIGNGSLLNEHRHTPSNFVPVKAWSKWKGWYINEV